MEAAIGVAEPDQLALHPPASPRAVLLAMRMTSLRISAAVGGRPGRRRLVQSYLRATSTWCQAGSVAGVTVTSSRSRFIRSSGERAKR